jgi:hypothetical protein
MIIGPKSSTLSIGQDGLNYYDVPIGQVDGGATFQLQISYQKSNDSLTQPSTFEQVTPVSPSGNAPSANLPFIQILPWLVGGLGLILIGAGVFWYLRGNTRSAALPVERHSRRQTANRSETSDEAVFCHQCGKKAAAGDVFCRACGTRLRH